MEQSTHLDSSAAGQAELANAVSIAEFPGVVRELTPAPRAEELYPAFARLPYCVFFDSALRHPTLGRYSFLAADPFAIVKAESADLPTMRQAFQQLKDSLRRFSAPTIAGLPPFQGGAAGVFGYELGRLWERITAATHDEFATSPLVLGLYDVVLAFDHVQQRAWLISQGLPELQPAARRERAEARAAEFLGVVTGDFRSSPQAARKPASLAGAARPVTITSNQYPTGRQPALTSDFSEEQYLAVVRRAVDYIHAGDIFQVNLSQRLLHPAVGDAAQLYQRLRACNRATFAGYFDAEDFQIASASPERFLRVSGGAGGEVEARPIKGTRSRHAGPEADLFAGSELQASEKDRAENVMIVDLLRNDLSRVCNADSVRVTQLCQLETYAHVKHLVSAIRGRLQSGLSAIDLLPAAFPGGSVTGAPKVRAMEIIAELEPTARGPYCGSLGYVGFDGALDASILIRTITASGGWWQAPVGGGIIAASDPRREYEETWSKAAGMLEAMASTGSSPGTC